MSRIKNHVITFIAVRPFSFSKAAWVAPKLVNVTFYEFFNV